MLDSFHGDGQRHPISPALRTALLSADAEHRASLEVLRDAICEYVDHLREQGVPWNDIGHAIQSRIAELRFAGAPPAVAGRLDGVLDEMIASCVEPAG